MGRQCSNLGSLMLGVTATLLFVATSRAMVVSSDRVAGSLAVASRQGGAVKLCSASQLRMFFLAGSAAAGTELTGIGIDNVSRASCSLKGVPAVAFLMAGEGRRHGIRVRYVRGNLPRVLTTPTSVTMAPARTLQTKGGAPKASGGFVIATGGLRGHSGCRDASALTVSVPGITARFRVRMRFLLCGHVPSVGVSAIVGRAALKATL